LNKRFFKIAKISIIYILLFIILYNESTIIGQIRFGVLWKIPLLTFLLIYTLINSIGKKDLSFLFVSLLFVLKLVLNTSFPENVFKDATSAFSELFLPLSYYYFKYKYSLTPKKVLSILIHLSIFYLLSSLPFIFKLISPNQNDIDMLSWGGYQNINLLTGLFYSVDSSSKVFVFSTIVVLVNFERFKRTLQTKLFYYSLVILGIYSTFYAFTRTGWLSLIFGVLLYYFYNTNLKQKSKFIFASVTVIVLFMSLGEVTELIQNRVLGIRTVSKKNYTRVDELTSSRSILFDVAYKTITQADTKTLFFGYGEEQGRIEFTKYINKAMVAHNRFLEITISGGLLALFLFLLMLRIMIKKVRRQNQEIKYSNINKTANILLMIYIFYLFPSHGLPIWADVIMGGYIYLKEARLNTKIMD